MKSKNLTAKKTGLHLANFKKKVFFEAVLLLLTTLTVTDYAGSKDYKSKALPSGVG